MVHQRPQGRRPAPEGHRRGQRPDPARAAARVCRLRGDLPALRAGGFRRAVAARLRAAARQPGHARALPGALPPCAGGRVPGHQPHPVRLAAAVRRARAQPVRGRRRRPVHLRLARRQGGKYSQVRKRLPRHAHHPPGAELPLHRHHPQGRQRRHRPQHRAPRQEPVDRGRGGRTDPVLHRLHRLRRGALRDRSHPGLGRARPRARRVRHPVPFQRAVTPVRGTPDQRGHSLSRVRRPALFRARRDQGRAGLPAAHGQPPRRCLVRAGGKSSNPRHRRQDRGRAARARQG